MRRSRSFLALLFIVLIVVPTLLAQTDPIPLPPDGQDTGTPSFGRLLPPLTLLSPADGAVEVEPLPVFRWTAHPDAAEYTLIVKRGKKTKLKMTFDASEICAENVCTVNTAALPEIKALKPEKIYRWQVKTNAADKIKSKKQTFIIYTNSAAAGALPTYTPYGQGPADGGSFKFRSVPNYPTVQVNAASVSAINNAIQSGVNPDGSCKAQHIVIVLNSTGSTYNLSAPYPTFTPAPDSTYVYGNTGIRPIECYVTIKGQGKILSRSSTTSHYRILTVLQNAYLRIENLIVEKGSATDRGGGGISNHQGELEIFRSTIRNNTVNRTTSYQWFGGGIYSYFGRLSILESAVQSNVVGASVSAGDGGGIGVIGSIPPLIEGNSIQNNQTKRNGDGLFLDTSSTVRYNCLVNNAHVPTPPALSISVYSPGTNHNWQYNWWGSVSGPLVNQNPMRFRDSINVNIPGVYIPYRNVEPANCTAPAPSNTPTPSLTPKPTLTPTVPICTSVENNGRATCATITPTPTATPEPSCVIKGFNAETFLAPITQNPVISTLNYSATWKFVLDQQYRDHIPAQWYHISKAVQGTQEVPLDAWIPWSTSVQFLDEGYGCDQGYGLPLAQKYINTSVPHQNVAWDEFSGLFERLPLDTSIICNAATTPREIHSLGIETGAANYPLGEHNGVDLFVPDVGLPDDTPQVSVKSIGTGLVVGIGKTGANGLPDPGTHAYWGAAQQYYNGEVKSGYSIIVRYGHLYVLYGHLKEVDANIWVGKKVYAGNVLGKLGKFNTRHLHIEVRGYGSAIEVENKDLFNPAGILPINVTAQDTVAPYVYDLLQFIPDISNQVATLNENGAEANAQVELQSNCIFTYKTADPTEPGTFMKTVYGYRGFIEWPSEYTIIFWDPRIPTTSP